MPSWKKVLVSGSSIEVNQITASGVPTDNASVQNLLAIDSSTGGILQISQSGVGADTFKATGIRTGDGFISGKLGVGTDVIDSDALLHVSGGHLKVQNAGNTNIYIDAQTDHTGSIQFQEGGALTARIISNPTNNSLQLIPNSANTVVTVVGKAVGIMDTAPTEVLSVNGNISASGDLFINRGVHFGNSQDNASGGATNQGDYFDAVITASADALTIEDNSSVHIKIDKNGANSPGTFQVQAHTTDDVRFVVSSSGKVGIGTTSLDVGDTILTVNGGAKFGGGVTSSNLPTNTSSTNVIVDGGSGKLESRDINVLLDSASGNLSSSIVGTTNEVEVTYPAGGVQVGLPDDVTITGDLIVGDFLYVSGAITASSVISASAGITASSIQVLNDIALGGNIFSFNGFSFIEGVSAVFTGSNVFGSGSLPSENDDAGGGVAHQFTGSVGITGSAVVINEGKFTVNGGDIVVTGATPGTGDGNITANNGTGSFGYLTANEISSSGALFADLANDSTTTFNTVVYDSTTGQFFHTGSYGGGGVNIYSDLDGIPGGIVSASSFSSPSQGTLSASINGQTTVVDLGLQIDDNVTFVDVSATTISASSHINGGGNLTVAGNISGSGDLFAALTADATTGYKTVVYDEATGKFHTTGSYGGGGGGVYNELSGIPTDIVSESLFSSDNQGSITASINGVSQSFDVGLTPTDSPTFNDITASGNVSVAGNTTITGDLTVNGSTTTISTANMVVEDTFILLASGSAGDALNDGGIIVEQTAAGLGVALYWDTSEQNWSICTGSADHTQANGGVTADVNVLTVQLADNSGNAPTSTPVMGVAASSEISRKGHFYVDTSDAFGLYVYT